MIDIQGFMWCADPSKYSPKDRFRSISSDNSYRFFRNEMTADGWKLDQAMLDAHPTAFLHWLGYLESRLL